MTFSIIDIAFVALIGLFMIRCYIKGFVSELLSVAAIVFGLLVALFLHKNGGELLRKFFWQEINIVHEVVAFVVLFAVVFVIVKLIEKMLVDIVDEVSLTKTDYIIGIFFGIAEGFVVVSLVLFLIKIQPLFDSNVLLADSFFARLLLPLITGRESFPINTNSAFLQFWDTAGVCGV
ncbi:MAG: CvpA family protein [Treponema sp.]|nr:CvpA family protein [Treponema sp.]